MSNPDASTHEPPQTLEGWWMLHDLRRIDWPRLRALSPAARAAVADEAAAWLRAAQREDGDSAAFRLIGDKGDLLFLHYRSGPAELSAVEDGLQRAAWSDLLPRAGAFLSVIEVSLYEAMAMAAKRLAEQGLQPGGEGYAAAYERELAVQRERLETRLRPVIPTLGWVCFYPMSKRRGERDNWYDLPLDQRRALMRGHGRIGHKYHQQVTQVIGGAIGLDDWEWSVDLHADDCLVFKKLVTEMRFDPASSRFAEFGPFVVGHRLDVDGLAAALRLG